ncbi:hypothetical protein BV25DRAFT_1922121 [Artomyces pyxidatus]|uniref:Uncharacterized protein n=1 Tax=Artomyces pyxidatus TaxID=48021 RepID=A0ACB8SFP5_9AGAM|nr:hypothetical protein BV25DRAFT_1922121 [Artomyces pyxidatus]
MRYRCVTGCKHTFDTANGLDTHQNTCQHFAKDDTSLSGLAEKLAAKRARKRRRLEERSVAHEPVEGDVNIPDVSEQGAPIPIIVEPPPPAIPVPQPPSPRGRGLRKKRATWKVLEQLPQPPSILPDEPERVDSPPPGPDEVPPAPQSSIWCRLRTALNGFGLYREYHSRPTHSPDDTISLEDVSYTSPENLVPAATSRLAPPISSSTTAPSDANVTPTWAPFHNMSIFCLMNWMWSGSSSKSITELDRLVHEVLLAPDFRTEDLEGFDAKRETDRLDKALGSEKENSLPIAPEDGPPIPIFSVPGLHHRSLIATIKATWADASATQFHFSPFRQFWRNGDKVERVRDEIYSSEAFVQADEEVRNLPPEPGCTLERTVCAMMFWSDSTHLTNFGTAALWPLYLFFGNQSKYTRANPRSGACHHVAYIPKLPDSFFDFFLSITGMPPTDEVVTHCRRELMHAVLRMMLDDKFIHAYQHGIVIKCADEITRPDVYTLASSHTRLTTRKKYCWPPSKT